MISRLRLWIPPRRCRLFVVPLYTCRLWAYGTLHTDPVGLLGNLSTWALQMLVILIVHCECPVGRRFLTSWTRENYFCVYGIIPCQFVAGCSDAGGFYIRTCSEAYLHMPHGLLFIHIKENTTRNTRTMDYRLYCWTFVIILASCLFFTG